MKDKVKNICIMMIFIVLLGGFFVINMITPDKDISYSERRPLKQFPTLNAETIGNTEFMTKYEDYLLDQFAGRDTWRSIKAFALYNIFGQLDNNGIYNVDGTVGKLDSTLNESSVAQLADKFNKLMQEKFPNNNVYYSIIPDKNYFLTQGTLYPDINYDKMQEILKDSLASDIEYIDIFSALTKDSYYLSDHHWSQDKIIDVAKELADKMGVLDLIDGITYDKNSIDGFNGAYSGQYPLPLDDEKLVYLTTDSMKDWIVKITDEKAGINNKGQFTMVETDLYAVDKFGGTDPYDVFLHGANPLITIENPNNASGKELFIFRDSYGSSLSPLLVEGYSKVTIIDLRYMHSSLLDTNVDFGSDNDVLFMYYTNIYNNASLIKA